MHPGAIIGPYKIISLIGWGGMGEVYRAQDTRLDRIVAVKVLPKDFASDTERQRRFERETKTLAALNHPNVLTVHDAGVHEGVPYLVSELLRGQTLREELGEGVALPLRKAVEYARQIAEGLAAAHGKRVVHRDLKPENIYVSQDGHVKILDFGLAKFRENPKPDAPQAGSPKGSTIAIGAEEFVNTTAPQMVLGTPGYMSPEQVRGDPVDQRTDIFAFGCVLYEMLSGARSFPGNTAVERMNAALKDAPTELSAIDPRLPASLGRLVGRCLEKQPDDRFQSAKDLAFALEQTNSREGVVPTRSVKGVPSWKMPAVFVIVAAVLGLCVWMFMDFRRSKSTESASRSSAASFSPAVKSVAVLPFVNMSADKENEYLSDGITEELINVLTKVNGLRVPGRTSCFSFKGKTEQDTFRKVGAQLHVNAVLEGTVQKAGNQLRISAQLVNVADGFDLWSETYDRDMTNIFAIQSDIATRVTDALKVRMGIEETRILTKKPTENIEAYRLYLLGRYHFAQSSQPGWTAAMRYFNEALALDHNYALAYCGLADVYGWLGGMTMPGSKAWAMEKQLAEKALAIDPSLGEAHLSLGIALMGSWAWRDSEKEIKRSLELNPGLVLSWDQYSFLLDSLGRSDEAVASQQKAVEFDPLSAFSITDLAERLLYSRKYDESIAQSRRALDLDPTFAFAHLELGWGLLWKGETNTAIREFEESKRLDDLPETRASLGYARAISGDSTRSEQILRELEEIAKQKYVSSGARATVYLGLGQKEKAFYWLEQSYDEQDLNCQYFKIDPRYDSLRNEPRFKALLHKVGLDN